MKRRDFLRASALAALPLGYGPSFAKDADHKPRSVMTVAGEVRAEQLGRTLPHEHILVDFVGADQVTPDRYDAGWYSVGEPRGGKIRGFDTLFTKFVPAMKKAGFSDDDVTLLIVTSPAKAFSIAVRSA